MYGVFRKFHHLFIVSVTENYSNLNSESGSNAIIFILGPFRFENCPEAPKFIKAFLMGVSLMSMYVRAIPQHKKYYSILQFSRQDILMMGRSPFSRP